MAVADLVVGDLVLLEAGDRIAADLRLEDAHDLTVDESMLTGESVPLARAGGVGRVRRDLRRPGRCRRHRDRDRARPPASPGSPPSPRAPSARRARSPSSCTALVLVVAGIAVAVGALLAVASVSLGTGVAAALLLGVGVMVALVPEGLLPTVTLSLARGAQRMAGENALVRRLDAVETLGATTFICTDKTGTLTRNEMAVVEGWTPAGPFTVTGTGYDPDRTVTASPGAVALLQEAATGFLACVTGRAVLRDGGVGRGRRPDGRRARRLRRAASGALPRTGSRPPRGSPSRPRRCPARRPSAARRTSWVPPRCCWSAAWAPVPRGPSGPCWTTCRRGDVG